MLTNRMLIKQFVKTTLDKMVVEELANWQNGTVLKMIVVNRGILLQ